METQHTSIIIPEPPLPTPQDSHYDLLKQLEKTTAKISILDILNLSNVHKEILYKTL